MYSQSISGIRANLDAFSQAAARIARPQTATDAVDIPDEKIPPAGESADEMASRSRESEEIDLSQEMVNMLVAQRGVEANLGALKSALSLSGQMVDILA